MTPLLLRRSVLPTGHQDEQKYIGLTERAKAHIAAVTAELNLYRCAAGDWSSPTGVQTRTYTSGENETTYSARVATIDGEITTEGCPFELDALINLLSKAAMRLAEAKTSFWNTSDIQGDIQADGFHSPSSTTSISDLPQAMQQVKLYIGGIPEDITPEGLKKFFSAFGEVDDAMVIPDPLTRKSSGYGVIMFRNPESAANIPGDLNIHGCSIAVRRAENPQWLATHAVADLGGLVDLVRYVVSKESDSLPGVLQQLQLGDHLDSDSDITRVITGDGYDAHRCATPYYVSSDYDETSST